MQPGPDKHELPETLTLAENRVITPVSGARASEVVAPGQIVADRFQIVRKLGEGGMAVVYEAIDRKLNEPRALKFPKGGHLQGIPQETRNALRVTHDNICRTHEIHTMNTGGETADFISMELLEGETLLKRWRREPLPGGEAVDIACQLCRGLEAAHSAQILHQDLKSSNVMLTRRGDGSVRAVITDFGLALPLGGVMTSHKLGGTPNYIAPERWKGAEATPASDVYALGVILYELLAGKLPFPHGTPVRKRLTELPEPPSRSERKPDRRWDPIVLKCLVPDTSKRFASAGEVRIAIEQTFLGVGRRKWLIAAAVAALALSPVALLRDRIWPRPLVRLAVLPFAGSAGDQALDQGARGALHDLGKRLEWLAASSQRLLVIPLEDAQRSNATTNAMAVARLSATHTLSGTIDPRKDGFAVRTAITDAHTGAVLREFTGEFRAGDLSVLSGALAGVVTSAFHLEKAPAVSIAAAAYPQYAAGLKYLREEPANLDRAIEALQHAIQLDDSSALIHGNLADAYVRKFTVTKDSRWLDRAKASARRAESLQPDSPPVLAVLGSIEQTQGRPERAIELFRRAAALEPKDWETWRRLGLAYQQASRDEEAVSAMRQAVRIVPDYFRPHLGLGFIYFQTGRYAEAADEYRTATRLAPDQPEGYSYLGAALNAMEKVQEAEVALRKAVQLQETWATLNNLGVLLRYEGRDREAAGVLQRALRAGGDDASLRLNLGNALQRVGRTADARVHFERASELARAALRSDPRNAVARARLSYSMVRLGGAALAGDEALQATRLAPNDYSVIFWSIMTLESLGRRDDALSLLSGASAQRLRDIRRQPDLADFARDPRFLALLQSHALSSNPERKYDAQRAPTRDH